MATVFSAKFNSHVNELSVALSVPECSSDCNSCDNNGAGKCDSGECKAGYGLNSQSECASKSENVLSLEVYFEVMIQLRSFGVCIYLGT